MGSCPKLHPALFPHGHTISSMETCSLGYLALGYMCCFPSGNYLGSYLRCRSLSLTLGTN